MEKVNIQGVPETMLQTLFARAAHSQKKGHRFYDGKAIEMVQQLDYDFSKAEKDTAMSSGVIARTILLDRMVGDFIRNNPDAVVVNLACGLDTRVYRLDNGRILRIAREGDNIFALTQNMMMTVVGVFVLLFFFCILMANYFTKNLVAPIEQMAENLSEPGTQAAYKELVPFMNKIRQQHEDILKSSQVRQEFTANVSHELKTPLTAISGYAELIEHGMSGENTERFASEIHKNAARLLTLINDIIQLSQLDGGKKDVEYRDLDLFPLARECVDMLQMNAQKQNVTIRVQGGEAPVFADKQLMEELIYNLCDNAIRYNKKDGTVTVTTGIENGHTFLSVKDTGIGISAKHQERVFERFYRVDKSRSKATGGTGLGLAIVKHIVAQHGAKLTLESEQGKGTEIRVEFSEALKQHELETAKQRQEAHAERSENGSSD